MTKPYIISIPIGILFVVASYFFLTARMDYLSNQEKANALNRKSRLVSQQNREIIQKKRILTRVDTFMNKAKAAGLTNEQWAHYEVNIDESITSPKLERILNQSVNASSFYFKPNMVHIKKRKDLDQIKTDSKDPEKGDILLTLKGTFIARQN